MSEILLKAGEAAQAATDVRTASTEAQADFDALKAKLSSLADSFRGQTATAWDGKYQEWHTGALQMMDGLDGLGEFLKMAADAIEETDTTLAGNLGG